MLCNSDQFVVPCSDQLVQIVDLSVITSDLRLDLLHFLLVDACLLFVYPDLHLEEVLDLLKLRGKIPSLNLEPLYLSLELLRIVLINFLPTWSS